MRQINNNHPHPTFRILGLYLLLFICVSMRPSVWRAVVSPVVSSPGQTVKVSRELRAPLHIGQHHHREDVANICSTAYCTMVKHEQQVLDNPQLNSCQ